MSSPINPRENAGSELNFLLPKNTFEEPLWKSLLQNLDDFFFPKKQPPLILESKPIPVRDIWGFYSYKKNGALGSSAVHVLALALIIGGTYLANRMVKEATKPREVVSLIAPDDIPPLPPSKTQVGGGGGGGDRDKLQASKGKLPKLSMQQQITPPLAVVRNLDPKLPIAPTIVVPPEIKLQQPNVLDLGDPMSHLPSV